MRISTVLIPLIPSELSLLKTWLRYCPHSGKKRGLLFLSIDQSWCELAKKEVADAFSRCSLHREGWRIEFVNCGMTPDESFYIKDALGKVDLEKYPYGQKSGPNMQFFRSMRALRHASREIGAVLLMEVDAFPIMQGWARRIDDKFDDIRNDILIIGARYAGTSRMAEQIKMHFNGNAIYFVGRNDFYHFLDCWENLLISGNKVVPYLAYDIVIPWYINYKISHVRVKALENDETRYLEDCFKGRFFDSSDYIINYGGQDENDEKYVLDVEGFVKQHPNALIVHGKCFHERIYTIRTIVKNGARRNLVNIVQDLILNDEYEEAILCGVRDANIVRRLVSRIDKLKSEQISVVNREWCTEVRGGPGKSDNVINGSFALATPPDGGEPEE